MMNEDTTQTTQGSLGDHRSPFEAIKQFDDNGNEWWSARALSKLLEYSQWQTFKAAIERAMVACANGNVAKVDDHFIAIHEMVPIGSGAKRDLPSYRLSRYACYLIFENGDSSKPMVALAQSYFALQTRRQELADLALLPESRQRLYLRQQVRVDNKDLSAAAQDAGVQTPAEHAVFQDQGYKGLYNGLSRRGIHKRKGLTGVQDILDNMQSTELAANWFRITQTTDKLRREAIEGKDNANRAHRDVGRVVRESIAQLGGAMPEDLPTPEKSIQQLEREQAQRDLLQIQPALFQEIVPEE